MSDETTDKTFDDEKKECMLGLELQENSATDTNLKNSVLELTQSDEIQSIVLDLTSKGKNPKQISAHYSLASHGLSEHDVNLIIKSHKGCLWLFVGVSIS